MNQTVVSSMVVSSVREGQRAVVVGRCRGARVRRLLERVGAARGCTSTIRPISTTASTAYSRVSTISEMSASPTLTPGETPFAVVIRPKTTQGWRPISVKIQPKELADDRQQRERERHPAQPPAGGARPRRVSQRISAAPARGQQAEPDHEPERPVGHRDDRRVVAGGVVLRARVLAVLLLVLRAQLVDALDLAVEVPVARNDSRHGTLIANFSCVPSRVPTVKIENGARSLSVS